MRHRERYGHSDCGCDDACGCDCDCHSASGGCDCECGCNCACGCDCGCHTPFRRRYQTKAEQIADLEAYLAELKKEVQAVEERLADLRKA